MALENILAFPIIILTIIALGQRLLMRTQPPTAYVLLDVFLVFILLQSALSISLQFDHLFNPYEIYLANSIGLIKSFLLLIFVLLVKGINQVKKPLFLAIGIFSLLIAMDFNNFLQYPNIIKTIIQFTSILLTLILTQYFYGFTNSTLSPLPLKKPIFWIFTGILFNNLGSLLISFFAYNPINLNYILIQYTEDSLALVLCTTWIIAMRLMKFSNKKGTMRNRLP